MQVISELNDLLNSMPTVLPKQPTFLEIARVPHYENVCSNILKFYFNPNNPHGFKYKLIDSLVKCCPGINISFGDQIEIKDIQREVLTENSQRIDLIIVANKWVIGIENKIYHYLNNDLEEYSNFLEKKYFNKKVIKVVLSLHPIANTTNGFVNVTYKQFIEQFEKSIDFKKIDYKNKYDIFFYDFVKTIKRLNMPKSITQEEIRFLMTNNDKIMQLQEMEDRFYKFVSYRIWRNIYVHFKETETLKIKVFEDRDIVFTYSTDNIVYKLECVIEKEGVFITICKEPNTVDLAVLNKIKYIQEQGINTFESNLDNSRLILKKFDFFTEDNQIINELNIILEKFHV